MTAARLRSSDGTHSGSAAAALELPATPHLIVDRSHPGGQTEVQPGSGCIQIPLARCIHPSMTVHTTVDGFADRGQRVLPPAEVRQPERQVVQRAGLSLIHISEPTRLLSISYAV